MTDEELDHFSALASDGDQSAVAKVLVHLLPVLSRVSRREAKGFVDPEDLQSHAVEALLRAWSQGTGPSTNVVGYLAQTMRNRVIDEMRSPRSRTRNLYETEDFVSDHDPSSTVELEQESQWVKRGLQRLNSDQQRLLVGIYYEGMKPAQLAQEFEKSPNAIYSLTRRSKLALRKATLQEALVEDAEGPCRVAAADLPETVANDFEETPATTSGMLHIEECQKCRASWKRFGSLTSALGIAGIIILAIDNEAVTPASAASLAGGDTRAEAVEGLGAPDTGSPNDLGASNNGTTGLGGSSTTETLPQQLRRRSVLVCMVAGAIIGGAATATIPLALGTEPEPAPAGTLALSIDHQNEITVAVDFQADDGNDATGQLNLTYPSSLVLQRTPDSVDCTSSPMMTICQIAEGAPSQLNFVFSGTPTLGEDLELALRATSGDYIFTGQMRSEVPKAGSSATTKAEVLAGQRA